MFMLPVTRDDAVSKLCLFISSLTRAFILASSSCSCVFSWPLSCFLNFEAKPYEEVLFSASERKSSICLVSLVVEGISR